MQFAEKFEPEESLEEIQREFELQLSSDITIERPLEPWIAMRIIFPNSVFIDITPEGLTLKEERQTIIQALKEFRDTVRSQPDGRNPQNPSHEDVPWKKGGYGSITHLEGSNVAIKEDSAVYGEERTPIQRRHVLQDNIDRYDKEHGDFPKNIRLLPYYGIIFPGDKSYFKRETDSLYKIDTTNTPDAIIRNYTICKNISGSNMMKFTLHEIFANNMTPEEKMLRELGEMQTGETCATYVSRKEREIFSWFAKIGMFPNDADRKNMMIDFSEIDTSTDPPTGEPVFWIIDL